MAVVRSTPQSKMPAFPRVWSLNMDDVELFYDVDLDELTVLFYGRQHRHSLRELSDYAYALIDPHSGELVGVEFHQFIKKFVPRDPSLGAAISIATILSNEMSSGHDLASRQSAGLFNRLYEQWKRFAMPRRVELREVLLSLQALSNSEAASGTHY